MVQLTSNAMATGSNLRRQGIETKAMYTEGGLVYECTGECTLGRAYSVRKCTVDVQFFNLSLKLTNQRQPKVMCLLCH